MFDVIACFRLRVPSDEEVLHFLAANGVQIEGEFSVCLLSLTCVKTFGTNSQEKVFTSKRSEEERRRKHSDGKSMSVEQE